MDNISNNTLFFLSEKRQNIAQNRQITCQTGVRDYNNLKAFKTWNKPAILFGRNEEDLHES